MHSFIKNVVNVMFTHVLTCDFMISYYFTLLYYFILSNFNLAWQYLSLALTDNPIEVTVLM